MSTSVLSQMPTAAHHSKLVARRGSVSAPDPYDKWNVTPPKSTTCKLTIVRVQTPKAVEDASNARQKWGSHRRTGSASSVGSNSPQRLSFACNSFTGGAGTGSRPGSPVHTRNPSGHRRSGSSTSSLVGSQQHLTPGQLLNIAKQSCNPQTTPFETNVSQASFIPLPENVYLPFINRPTEVSSLISTTPSTKKLLALLAQTLDRPLAPFPGPNPDSQDSQTTNADPKTWVYADVHKWLTTVDRDSADDRTWTLKLRQAIMPRNELIWERIKGILGVPPELDTEDDEFTFDPPDFKRDNLVGKEMSVLSVETIHAALPSPTAELAEISEDAPEMDMGSSAVDVVRGLCITTTPIITRRAVSFSSYGSIQRPHFKHVKGRSSDFGEGHPVFPGDFSKLGLQSLSSSGVGEVIDDFNLPASAGAHIFRRHSSGSGHRPRPHKVGPERSKLSESWKIPDTKAVIGAL